MFRDKSDLVTQPHNILSMSSNESPTMSLPDFRIAK
jgi:hypothetical protein